MLFLVLGVMACGCGERVIPYSDFKLKTGTTNRPPGGGGLGFYTMLPDNTLTFEYEGSETLSEVHLSVEVIYPNCESRTYKLYLGFWKPKTSKGLQLPNEFIVHTAKGYFIGQCSSR